MKRNRRIIVLLILVVLSIIPIGLQAVEDTTISTKAFLELLKKVDTEGRLDKVESVNSEEILTREQAAVWIVKVLGYEGIANDYRDSQKFSDVQSKKGEIHLISDLGIMTGTGERLFSPQGKVTKKQAKIITDRIVQKLTQLEEWTHVSYAISSSSQMERIKEFSAVSFGWAQINYDSTNQSFKVNIELASNDFKVPAGFEGPIDFAKTNGVETYLMIYFENQGDSAKILLNDTQKSEAIITDIVKLSQGITKDGQTRAFDGVTIDFEQFYNNELQQPFNQFLKRLSQELKKVGKKLNVAVQPNNYFKGYDYKGIGEAADHVIIMAHDYGAKSLTESEREIGTVITPITPINEIYKALKAMTMSIEDKSKIVLQISYGSLQWQTKDGKVIHSKAYTPSYDNINKRLLDPGTQVIYSEYYQNPYAVYEQNGIRNVIWYEDKKSVKAKVQLAKLMGVKNISYWRLGLLP